MIERVNINKKGEVMKNTTHKGIGMTKIFKLSVIGTMVVGVSTVMGAQPQVLTQLGISGSEPGVIRTACYVYDADKNLVDGVVLDAYNEPVYDEEGNIKENLAVIKCALPKPPKKPRHGKPTTTEAQVLLNYGNTAAICLSPQTIIEKTDEVKDAEGNIITEEEDAVLTDYATTEVWQNIVSASGEISLVCKHITPAIDTTPPVITLNPICNDINITLEKGETYIEANATAYDDFDGDITDEIIIDNSSVDTSTPGTYQVTYTVTDSAGNTATAIREVRVTEPVVMKTNQDTTYDTSGAEKTKSCDLKDDGYYQRGVQNSFTRSDTPGNDTTGVVTDNATGLVWQDNNESNSTNLAWNNAIVYCDSLELDGITDWRLPNVDELLSISDKSKSRLDDPSYSYYDAFKFIAITKSENVYISSTEYARTNATDIQEIWGVRFEDGRDYLTFKHEDHQRFTRCVSGTEASAAKNSTRDTQGIVTDNNTQLQWQNDTPVPDATWEDAINYCEGLALGSYTDWRLPNLNELYSIVDRTITDPNTPAVDTAFQNINGDSSDDVYWSSSTTIEYKDMAWVLRFSKGTDTTKAKSATNHVMCVR